MEILQTIFQTIKMEKIFKCALSFMPVLFNTVITDLGEDADTTFIKIGWSCKSLNSDKYQNLDSKIY